jgi:hypothetical protein
MKNKNLSNVFAFISLGFGAIWFGSYITRLILNYNLFIEGELVLKNYINNNNISGILEALAPLFYITSITYVIFIICFTLFLVTSKIKLKENGWLFIITVIIFFTFPFEVALMTIDYKLIILHISNNFDSELALTLIIERLQMLSSFSVILILSYFIIPYFLVFRPFSVKKDK